LDLTTLLIDLKKPLLPLALNTLIRSPSGVIEKPLSPSSDK
jgi:hypothetical protein